MNDLTLCLGVRDGKGSSDLEGQGVGNLSLRGVSEGVDCLLTTVLGGVDLNVQDATFQVKGSAGEETFLATVTVV